MTKIYIITQECVKQYQDDYETKDNIVCDIFDGDRQKIVDRVEGIWINKNLSDYHALGVEIWEDNNLIYDTMYDGDRWTDWINLPQINAIIDVSYNEGFEFAKNFFGENFQESVEMSREYDSDSSKMCPYDLESTEGTHWIRGFDDYWNNL